MCGAATQVNLHIPTRVRDNVAVLVHDGVHPAAFQKEFALQRVNAAFAEPDHVQVFPFSSRVESSKTRISAFFRQENNGRAAIRSDRLEMNRAFLHRASLPQPRNVFDRVLRCLKW